MIKIKFFCSFCDSENCKSIYERLCEVVKFKIYGADKEVYFTVDDDYTHVIIINTAMPIIPSHIPKKNIIGLAYEPLIYLNLTQNFVNYAVKNIYKYYIGDKLDLPEPFVENYGYMWHVTPLQHIPEKNKRMSIMVSQKIHTFGHKYRHVLVQNILKHELPIDIYGRGCINYSKFHSPYIKGNFENLEPYENYDFHIAIENVQSNHYFSEKIVNPMLCSTTPIYWGCKNIKEYFGDDVICLTGDVQKDLELIVDVLRNPEKYKKNIDVDFVKKKTSLLENIETVFQ